LNLRRVRNNQEEGGGGAAAAAFTFLLFANSINLFLRGN
jgi:hypothetical protein